MTKTKVLSLLTASMLSVSCLGMTAFADTAYEIGDVDMDGIITGHDTALVSRYLVKGDITLTAEQLALADVDGDGEVTQADADKLHNELQVYAIGDVIYDEEEVDIDLDEAELVWQWYSNEYEGVDNGTELDAVQNNLADVDADGSVGMDDVKLIMAIYALTVAGMGDKLDIPGVYYYSTYINDPGYLEGSAFASGDVDMDRVITGHDTALVSRYLVKGDITLTAEQLALADVDGDGEVTQADADKLHNEMQVHTLGLVLHSDKDYINIKDASEILQYIAHKGASLEYPMTQLQKNLADMDADGAITLDDAAANLTYYAMRGASMNEELDSRTVYYYTLDPNDPGFLVTVN